MSNSDMYMLVIKRKVFVLVPSGVECEFETIKDIALKNSEYNESEEIVRCMPVLCMPSNCYMDQRPLANPPNEQTIKQLIESGDLEFKK